MPEPGIIDSLLEKVTFEFTGPGFKAISPLRSRIFVNKAIFNTCTPIINFRLAGIKGREAMAVEFLRVLTSGMATEGEDNFPATTKPSRLIPALLS
jgi:hypothetical protein